VNIGLCLDNDTIRNALRYSRDDSRYRIDTNEAEQLQSIRSKDAEELANLETNMWHSRRKYSMQPAVTPDVQDSVIPEQVVRELEAGADRKGTLHEAMDGTPEADRENAQTSRLSSMSLGKEAGARRVPAGGVVPFANFEEVSCLRYPTCGWFGRNISHLADILAHSSTVFA
jgi:hypothetical protein